MNVKSMMTASPVCCHPDTSVTEAAKMMRDADCGSLPVVDDNGANKLVGIVTDRDIVMKCVARGKDPNDCRVRDCMTGNVISTSQSEDLDAAVSTMQREQIRRLPVIDDSGKCVGILAQADVALHADKSAVADLVRNVSEPAQMSAPRD
jgi:CBS domain-containing protein